MSNKNYQTIEDPYDSNLDRVMASLPDTSQGTLEEAPASAPLTGNSLDDLWIGSWIKSKHYKPGSAGFMFDGKTGNVELNNALFRGKVTFSGEAKLKTSDIINDLDDTNLDTLISSMGNLAFEDMVGKAMLDTTIIQDGVIATGLVVAENIVAGTINGFTITGSTITGGTVRTAASGTRIVIIDNELKSYYSSASYPALVINGEYIHFTGSSWDPKDGMGNSGAYISYNGGNLELHNYYNTSDTVLTLYDSEGRASINGDFSVGNTLSMADVDNSILPTSSGSYNLGSSSYKWNYLYAKYLSVYGSGSSAMTLSGDGTTMTVSSNFAPASSNSKYCGTSSNYWARVYADAYFTKNTTLQTFDVYDDLQIVRELEFDEKGKLVTDNLPPEIAADGFVNFGGLASFNLCALRRVLEAVDKLTEKVDKLEQTASNKP